MGTPGIIPVLESAFYMTNESWNVKQVKKKFGSIEQKKSECTSSRKYLKEKKKDTEKN